MFRQHYSSLYRYGIKFTADVGILEDCIQELFIDLWKSKSATPVLSVKSYLLKSLKYKLLKDSRQKGRLLSVKSGNDVSFEWSHEQFLIARQDDEQRKRRLVQALGQLSNRQKEIIYLKYYQNLSYEEVSEIMNINYQAARNLLYQAIKSLKALLGATMELFLLLL